MFRIAPWLIALCLIALVLLVLALRGAGEAPSSGDGTAAPDVPRIGRLPASQFHLEHDLFLPATDPKTVPAAKAAWLRDDDEVFGVVQLGHARAYPIYMLAYHHVVNDVLQGIPVAITY